MTVSSQSANFTDAGTWQPANTGLIVGTGGMADLVRAHPWECTPAGPVDQWSGTLLAMVNLILCSPIPTCICWGRELIMIYNDGYRSILDGRHPEALGKPVHEIWTESWGYIGPKFATVLAHGKPVTEENVLIPLNSGGRLQDFFWNYSLIPIHQGGMVAGVLNAAQDVTGTVLTMRLLTATDERLRMALAAGNCVGTWDWSLRDNLLRADEQFARHYGADPLLALAGAPADLFVKRIHADDVIRVMEAATRSMQTGEDYLCEYRLLQPDESSLWVEARGRCLFAADGSLERIRGVSIDITARKQTEAALLKSEKLAAAGKLAATLAHEINNPLEAVTNLLYLARSASDIAEIRQYLDLAEFEVHRASRISRQTLQIQPRSTTLQTVDCNRLIESVIAGVSGRTAPLSIQVDTRCRAGRLVVCSEREVRQVLTNLVNNAIDAMHHGDGRLLLRSRDGTDWETGRAGIVVTIADTGTGISQQILTEIFDPFFSTKGHGGTGLGLWISQESVDRHNGTLHVRSSQRPDRHGTVFTVFLPFAAHSP